MTSVVGILNKKGVAIAADSAVTRNRKKVGKIEKVTKNGNKMIRLSDIVHICVMVTGNADFLCNPWDIVIRRYRQERGKIEHTTVEAAVKDFFDYIAQRPVFWDFGACKANLKSEMYGLFNNACPPSYEDAAERFDNGKLRRPAAFTKAFLRSLKEIEKQKKKAGSCPQFSDYSFERFHSAAGDVVEEFLSQKVENPDMFSVRNAFPKSVIDAISEEFEHVLYLTISSCNYDECAELIFTGFGKDETYPSLVPVIVNEGYDFHVNYYVETDKVVHISDDCPVAVCPFAQDDVTRSILRGIHTDWSGQVCNRLDSLFNPYSNGMFDDVDGLPDISWETIGTISEIRTDDLIRKFRTGGIRMLNNNQKEWERHLKDYDLKPMAELAESLIDLTGFQRILTFEQEGVGGLVDLAVISKAEGFSWLNRKSWYHKKDTDGMHRKFGI